MPLNQFEKSSQSELKAELQVILDAVVEGVCGLDVQGNATFCNDALLKITGYRTEEIVGKNVHELLHRSREDGARYPAEECAFRGGLDGRQATHLAGEFFWRKDGTCFPAEFWMRPLQQSVGLTHHVATIKDITEIQQAREVRRKSEEKFRRILASTPDVAWTSDRKGRSIYISPKVEAVLGYSKAEICACGTHLRMGLIHAEDFGRVHQAYGALFDRQIPFDEEYRIRRKDGSWIWVQDRAMPDRRSFGRHDHPTGGPEPRRDVAGLQRSGGYSGRDLQAQELPREARDRRRGNCLHAHNHTRFREERSVGVLLILNCF